MPMRFVALNQKPIPRGEEEYTFVMSTDGVDLSRIAKRAAYVDLHHDYDRLVGRITDGTVIPNERLEVSTELWRDTPEAKAYADRYENGQMDKVSVEIGAFRRDVSSMGRGKKRVNRWSLLGMALTGHPADEDTGVIQSDLSLKGDDKPLTGFPPDYTDFDMVFRLDIDDGGMTIIANDGIVEPKQNSQEAEEEMPTIEEVQSLIETSIEKSNESLIAKATEAFTSFMAANKDPEPTADDTPKGPTFSEALTKMKSLACYANLHTKLDELAAHHELQGKTVAEFVTAAEELTKADDKSTWGADADGAGSGNDGEGANAEEEVGDALDAEYDAKLAEMAKQARYAGQEEVLSSLAFDMKAHKKPVAEFVDEAKQFAVNVPRVGNDGPRNNPMPGLARVNFELQSINSDQEKNEARQLLQEALDQFIRGNIPDLENPFVKRSIEGQRVSKLGQTGMMLRVEDLDIIELATQYGGTQGTNSVGQTATVVGPMFIRADVPDPLDLMPYITRVPSAPGEFVLATVNVPAPGMVAEPDDSGYSKTGETQTVAVKLTPHLLVERLNLTRVAELSQAGLTNFAIATAIMRMGEQMSGQLVAGDGSAPNITGIYNTTSLSSQTVANIAAITAAYVRVGLAAAKLGQMPLFISTMNVIDALKDIASPTAAGRLVENEMVDGVPMLRTNHLSEGGTKNARTVIAALGEMYVKQWDNAYFISRRYWDGLEVVNVEMVWDAAFPVVGYGHRLHEA